ncbi:MAG: trigger factor [Acidobacteria bacterium]|nr:trigger factor [Acidobacteriota bacterium]
MTAEIVEVNSCKRNLEVELPATELDQEINGLSREYARKAKVPGFRPGKVPLSIIQQRYGKEIRQEATQKIIERTWQQAIDEHNLKPLAQPAIKDIENKPDNPMKFTLSFEVLPDLEVKDYKEVPVTKASPRVTDEKVDQTIESYREQQAQFIPVDEGEAVDGHILTVTVDGRFEDDSEATRQEDITLVLGHPQTHEEFTKNLLGVKPGETRSFDVEYPEDYHQKQFSGKKVHWSVLVKEIKEKQLAELNDDFAKDIGHESLEAFKEKVRNDLITEATQSAEKEAREALLKSVMERQTVDVPECMVQDELESHVNRMATRLAMQGVDIQQASIDWKKVVDEERPRAEDSVRRSIFLNAIARQENIEISDEEVDSELQKIAEGTNKSVAALKAQLEKEGRIEGFKQHLRENKAFDFIYRNAKITVE